jgi:hypothetical protein
MPETPWVNITTYFELVTEIILWTDMNENPISAPEILESLVNQAALYKRYAKVCPERRRRCLVLEETTMD